MNKFELYLWNILLVLDEFLNTFTGGAPDEWLSSRMGKYLRDKRNCILCKFLCSILNKIQANHCENSIQEDRGSRSLSGVY